MTSIVCLISKIVSMMISSILEEIVLLSPYGWVLLLEVRALGI
jgi:hypothetical protein